MNDLDSIIQQLAHQDSRIRLHAVQALGKMDDKTVLSALDTMLKDDSIAVVRSAALAIGKIGDCDALPSLISLSAHADLWVRKAAVQAIGLTNCQDAVPVLVNLLGDESLDALIREALIALKVDPDFF